MDSNIEIPTLNSHTHCQAAQANRNSQSLPISVSEPTHGPKRKSTIAQHCIRAIAGEVVKSRSVYLIILCGGGQVIALKSATALILDRYLQPKTTTLQTKNDTELKSKRKIIVLSLLLLLTAGLISFSTSQNTIDDNILFYTVDTKTQALNLYWKNDKGENLKSLQNLKSYVESKNLILTFAMNGGMFNKDFSPQGLFIQNKITQAPLDTADGYGNFYLKPNGVFYITIDNIPFICTTTDFSDKGKIKYATQSGPMLVIDGQIHSAFKEGSTNLNIRNGVGILPDNKVIFAMSKTEINFYDFAKFFQSLGCKNALYLDGFVSKTYLPEKNWTQTDGNFGVIIGVTEKKN